MTQVIVFALLWFIAGVGHSAIHVCAINVLHGTRYLRWWMRIIRRTIHVMNVALPLWFAWHWGPVLATRGGWMDLPPLLLAYVVLCWFLGGVVVPWLTIRRWLRPTPAALVQH